MNILFAFVFHGSPDDVSEALSSLVRSIRSHHSVTTLSVSILVLENKYPSYPSSYYFALRNIVEDIDLNVSFIENKGYNAGLNCALNYAQHSDIDLLVAGNPDIIFDLNYFQELLLNINTDYLVSVPNVLNKPFDIPQNPRSLYFSSKLWLQKMNIYMSSYFVSQIYQLLYKLRQYLIASNPTFTSNEAAFECDLVSGVQFIFSIKKLPYDFALDENIFLWGEELSLLITLSKYKSRFNYLSTPKVFHKVSRSVSFLRPLSYFRIQCQSLKYLSNQLRVSPLNTYPEKLP